MEHEIGLLSLNPHKWGAKSMRRYIRGWTSRASGQQSEKAIVTIQKLTFIENYSNKDKPLHKHFA